MRSFVRHGLVLGACLSMVVAASGCEQKKATEYVTGISTQVKVPQYLKSVRLQVSSGGFVQWCNNYRVYDGKVLLPRSLGKFPQQNDANGRPITISIVGSSEEFREGSATNPVFTDCTSAAQVNALNVRILRRSTQQYKPDRILFLPMALKYSCFDKSCPEDQTCKGGVCVSDTTDPDTLEDYTDGMGDGTDGGCFSSSVCMGAALPAIPVTSAPENCDFTVAESADANAIKTLPPDQNPFRPACTPADAATKCGNGRQCTNGQCDLLPPGSPPWTGVNVEVTYDGGQVKEILDLDATEGFTIPDPNKPQTFRLAPGLCAMLKNTKDAQGNLPVHRITSVRASGTCAPKKDSQSICLPDQIKIMTGNDEGTTNDVDAENCKTKLLTPSKSALMLVVDHTTGHAPFFTADVQSELKIPLSDPAFEQTDIGSLYAESGSVCAGGPTPSTELAIPSGADNLIAKFQQETPSDTGTPKFEGPMREAYKFLNNLGPEYARRAVVVIGNRSIDVDSCDPGLPSDLAASELNKPSKSIATFAVKLTSDGLPGADPNAAASIATKGYPLNAENLVKYPYNAVNTADKKRALQEVINHLATCLYEVPLDASNSKVSPAIDSVLSYANPLTAAEVKIENVAKIDTNRPQSCDNNADGWALDTSDVANPRVRICGAACTGYQKVLSDTSTFTLLYSQKALAVPLYVSNAACYAPKK